MKKLIKKLFVAMACIAVACGFAFSPVEAIAEGETGTPENSAETGVFGPVTYRYEETENHIVLFELLDETNAILHLFERDTEVATVNATYEINGNVLSVDGMNGELTGDFYIEEDFTLRMVEEEVPETPESGEETEVNPTFEDILAAVQKEAERYGYGDKYAAAMEAIKTAATTKQVTISTIFSLLVVCSVIAYIIYSRIKDKLFKKEVKQLLILLEGQRDGTNALIDGTNENGKTVEATNAKVAATNAEVERIKKGLTCLTSAFLTFSEGIKYHEAKKTQVEMNCIKALKEMDGEVNLNENKAL